MKKIVATLLIVVVIAVGCSNDKKTENSTSTTTNIISTQAKVEFKNCGELDCATISVPMDYENPKGRKIKIAITKLAAADKAKRIGVLLINPGGPGASGNELVRSSAKFIFSKEVRDRFYIIGWDPRGSGDSTKVECAKNLDYLFDGIDYSPDTKQEENELIDANEKIGKQCQKEDSELLPFLNTESSVQDMDSIRKQLKEDKINFLGYSYGTVLGQIYATKYPQNFRTMVIDGVVDLEANPREVATDQAVGFESALNNFFEYCKTNTCKYASGGDPKSVFVSIMEKVDASPVESTTEDGFVLGPAHLDIGSSYFLYGGEAGWQSLDFALNSLKKGNPDQMLSGFASYVGRGPNGVYDGSYTSFLSIGCADGNIATPNKMLEIASQLKTSAPIFGESGILLGLPCASWPKVKPSKSFNVDSSGSAPIVVIGTTGDPATPVQWARNASRQLKTGVYIELRGEGHTAYGQGIECIDELVDNYLITAEEPNSKVC